MEPVGGMDNFVKAFARQSLTRQTGTIEGLVRFGARVDGDRRGQRPRRRSPMNDAGTPRALAADYCISTIPMPIFRDLKTNLPAPI